MTDYIGGGVSIWGNETVAQILGDRPAYDYWLGLQVLEACMVALVAARTVSLWVQSRKVVTY
jgi:hypothetical protein